LNTNNVSALYEERMSLVHQLRSLAATANGREFNAEERQSEERLNRTVDDLDSRIRHGLAYIERSNKADEARGALGAFTSGAAVRNTDPNFDAFLRGERRSYDVNLGPAIEARTLSKLSAGAGANVVPTSMGSLWEHLVDSGSILKTNAFVMNTSGGEDLQVPKTSTYSTASLVAEGAAIGASDPAFGQLTLKAYKYGHLIQVSSELLFDASIDTAGFLARESGTAIGTAIDTAFTTGTGSAQPMGVVTASTLGKTAAGTGAVTTDELIDLFHSVIPQYRANGSWIFNDATLAAIRKLKDTTNQYIWQPGLVAGQPDSLFGRPVFSDPNVATMATGVKFGVFGDMSRFVVRFAGALRFERSDDYAFNSDLVTFRALLRVDSNLTDTSAVKHIKNA
jgi:HK97 family phage major capsid protein